MTNDFSKSKWREQVKNHLVTVHFDAKSRESLKQKLLASGTGSAQYPVSVKKAWWRRFGVDYIAVAAAAAIAVVVIRPSALTPEPDAITDLVSIPILRSYPPDFDLEGDATSLAEIVRDVFPADAELPFQADIPQHIASKFSPTEGRFFTWAGEPGVSIRLNPVGYTARVNSAASAGLNSNASATHASGPSPSTLYIVKLSGISDQRFPAKRMQKRLVLNNGKERLVHVWRDGSYGYAVLQNVGNNSVDMFPNQMN